MSRANIDCKVYVGDLGSNASQTELEDAFSYYGPLTNVWVARNPPGFAFVEFEDPRDARDACRGLDGRTVCNRRITVEMSTGRSRGRGGGGGGGGFSRGWGGDRGGDRGGRYNPNDRCYECGEPGHYAYDCPDKRNHFNGAGGRKRSRSRDRDRRSRSRSRERRGRTRSYTRSNSRGSRSRSRSRSPRANGARD